MMNIEEFRNYCLQKAGTTESFPFGEDTLVFKVMDKMFALLSLNKHTANLKCEPNRALQLREKYSDIIPGYHMNKKHWNTIILDNLSSELIYDLIDHSYTRVADMLPKRLKNELKK